MHFNTHTDWLTVNLTIILSTCLNKNQCKFPQLITKKLTELPPFFALPIAACRKTTDWPVLGWVGGTEEGPEPTPGFSIFCVHLPTC